MPAWDIGRLCPGDQEAPALAKYCTSGSASLAYGGCNNGTWPVIPFSGGRSISSPEWWSAIVVSQRMPESLCFPTDRAARCPKEVFAGLPPVCTRQDSNLHASGYEPGALPTELLVHVAHRLTDRWAY